MAEWNERLRVARKNLGLSQEQIAERAGISVESVRAYELGRRHASRERLSQLLRSVNLDLASRNEILAAAGYSGDGDGLPALSLGLEQALALINERPWPVFLVNDVLEVLAANDFFRTLLGMSRRSRRQGVKRNMLLSVSMKWVASSATDWDGFVAGAIGIFKARHPTDSLAAPSAYLSALLDDLVAGDPALVHRFTQLWESTPARRSPKLAWSYRTSWRYPGDRAVRFLCSVYAVNPEQGLEIHEWIPADAESHGVLEQLLAEGAARQTARTD